jgi:hypothetical protein
VSESLGICVLGEVIGGTVVAGMAAGGIVVFGE